MKFYQKGRTDDFKRTRARSGWKARARQRSHDGCARSSKSCFFRFAFGNQTVFQALIQHKTLTLGTLTALRPCLTTGLPFRVLSSSGKIRTASLYPDAAGVYLTGFSIRCQVLSRYHYCSLIVIYKKLRVKSSSSGAGSMSDVNKLSGFWLCKIVCAFQACGCPFQTQLCG